jgi:hypothetical protein
MALFRLSNSPLDTRFHSVRAPVLVSDRDQGMKQLTGQAV